MFAVVSRLSLIIMCAFVYTVLAEVVSSLWEFSLRRIKLKLFSEGCSCS